MSFKVRAEPAGMELRVFLSGSIDEMVKLPQFDLAEYSGLIIDLEEIDAINSVGIRSWLIWMDDLRAAGIAIRFIHVPSAIVFQFNQVEGFLPKEASVDSFYIPMSCDKCSSDIKALVRVDERKVPSLDIEEFRTVNCEKKSCSLAPTYSEYRYFAFLKLT